MRFIHIRTLLLCALLLFSNALQAAPEFPALTGRVVDQAGILSQATITQLTAKLQQEEQETGNQIVVVTLNSLQGYDIADYGYQLGRHWAIGTEKNNNGALLIVAPTERKMRIEVGYGLEGWLTDAISSDIIRNKIRPAFKAGDYNAGVTAGIDSMIAAVKGSYKAETRKASGNGSTNWFAAILPLTFLALMIISEIIKGGRTQRAINALISATVFGIVTWSITSLAIVGIFVAVAVFIAIMFSGGGGSGGSGGTSNTWGGGSWGGGGGFGGGGFGGGGFGGGGGSFGGGGSSGSW